MFRRYHGRIVSRAPLSPMVTRGAGAIVALAAVVLIGRALLAPKAAPTGGDARGGDAASDAAETREAVDRATFAEEMADAVREGSPDTTVQVDDERFVLEWEKGDDRGEMHLERTYRAYEKLPAAEREAFVRDRASKIAGPALPATFAEAAPKLVPLVRERIDYELARIMASKAPIRDLGPEPPHVALTDDLWGVLAYETDDQFVRLDGAALARWNVRFDDVWPKALARLAERSSTFTQDDAGSQNGLHVLRFGDDNDSARVLVPGVFAQLGLGGDAVVGMPKEDVLLVAPAQDDAAVGALMDRLVEEWDRGAPSLRIVRVGNGKTAPFVVSTSHPLHAKLADLVASADQRDEELQREALKDKLGEGEDAPYVAARKRVRNDQTQEELSFVVHTEETPTLLPQAEWVVFRRVDLTKKTATTLACGTWDKVYAMMKGRWKDTPLRPARWLATDLPSAEELRKLGCEHPVLRLDMGIARPVQ
jgi:hypothetical protein